MRKLMRSRASMMCRCGNVICPGHYFQGTQGYKLAKFRCFACYVFSPGVFRIQPKGREHKFYAGAKRAFRMLPGRFREGIELEGGEDV